MASTINSNEQYTILGSTLQSICDSVSKATGNEDVPVPMIPKMIDGINLKYEDIKDVMFMDYNGDLLYSWDKDDFIYNVDELPAGPTWHTGLTFQEWNWDLADIKDELQNGSGACCIGANYTTTDGKTHFFINLTEECPSKKIQFYITRISGTMVVDWGDGTSTNSYSSTTTAVHTYADYGKYEIKVSGGQWGMIDTSFFMRNRPTNEADAVGYFYYTTNLFLEEAWIGTNCFMYNHSQNVFTMCKNLKSISFHKDIFKDNGYAFCLNYQFMASGLRFLAFPKYVGTVTSFSTNPLVDTFSFCKDLITVSFPKGFHTFKFPMFNESGINFLYFPTMTTLDTAGNAPNLAHCNRLMRVAMKFSSYSTTNANGFYQFFYNLQALRKISTENLYFGAPNAYTCYYCRSLDGTLTFPGTVTALTGNNFHSCYSVKKYVFLGNLTAIGVTAGNVFNNNMTCLEWDFTHCTTVPTLYNTNCFTNISSKAVIKVPAALETSWKAATNWSTYADRIVGV